MASSVANRVGSMGLSSEVDIVTPDGAHVLLHNVLHDVVFGSNHMAAMIVLSPRTAETLLDALDPDRHARASEALVDEARRIVREEGV